MLGADITTGPAWCTARRRASGTRSSPSARSARDARPVARDPVAGARRRGDLVDLGVATGVLSALRRGSMFDRAAMGVALAGVSLPIFFTGLSSLSSSATASAHRAGRQLHPITDDPARVGVQPAAALDHAGVPVLRGLRPAHPGRDAGDDGEDYIRTARAKGLSERPVVVKHGLRAALTPILTIFGLDLGLLLGGAVLTESTFSLPGMGKYAIDAISRQRPAQGDGRDRCWPRVHHRGEPRRRPALRRDRPESAVGS